MMLRKLSAVLVFVFVFLVCAPQACADEGFDISDSVKYDVSESGNTTITSTITIKNKTEFTYTPSYSISTGLKDIRNIKTYNPEGAIPNKVSETEDGGKSIEVNFEKRYVGIGIENKFTLSFETGEIVKKKGSIWEINIPGLANPSYYYDYSLMLSVPQSFGPPQITKPYKKLLPNNEAYRFSLDEIGKSGILITFGNSQYYKLSLKYAISNPRLVPVKTEIALPPNTSYQDVRINKITPPPLDVYLDIDANWLAVYELSPKQVKNIHVEAIIKVFGNPVFDIEKRPTDMSPQEYWEVNDSEIAKIARTLGSPFKIYEYVVKTLSYNYEKVNEKNIRIGAKGAIKKPDFAVCLEFTDLFVALARSSQIPTRAVEGYAYTENSKLRPLSLVSDILHSWPEYYDDNRKAWIMVDPTWGNTTGGMDYFNSFDFDHIAFVVKGKSSTYPIPAGGYKIGSSSKDVDVQFASREDYYDKSSSNIIAVIPRYSLSGMAPVSKIVVENKGNVPIRGKRLIVTSDFESSPKEFYIDEVLPYGSKVINVEFKKTPLLTNKAYKVKILFDGQTISKTTYVGLFPNYFIILIGGVIIIGSLVVAKLAYKTWSIYIQGQEKQDNLRGQSPRS